MAEQHRQRQWGARKGAFFDDIADTVGPIKWPRNALDLAAIARRHLRLYE
jgi:hypothetical protein